MSSTIEVNDMCQQMKSLMNSHKKISMVLARLEQEKRFTDASFRKIYKDFSDYRTQTDLRIEELTKDLDDQKNILRKFSHIMVGETDTGSNVILVERKLRLFYIYKIIFNEKSYLSFVPWRPFLPFLQLNLLYFSKHSGPQNCTVWY